MRKLSAYLLAALLLAACTPEQPAGENTFYVSIPPLRSIVEGIVGDDFKIEVLVPPGASPETFEPTPRQFVELNKAQLIFNVGLIDFETTLLGKVGDQAKVVNLSRGIDLDRRLLLARPPRTRPRACPRCRPPRLDLAQSPANDGRKRLRGNSQRLSRLGEIRGRLQPAAQHAQGTGHPHGGEDRPERRRSTSSSTIPHSPTTHAITDMRQVAIEADGKEPSAKQLTAGYPTGPRGRRAADPLSKSVPGIVRGDHRPRHRRRIRRRWTRCDEDAIANIDAITDINHGGDESGNAARRRRRIRRLRGPAARRPGDCGHRLSWGSSVPNGGGKTTLVKAILGTVPHTGEVTARTRSCSADKERLIGYMPQISDFDRAFPISVLEVVLSGLQGRTRNFQLPLHEGGPRQSDSELLAAWRESPTRPAAPSARCRAGRCSGRCWPGP